MVVPATDRALATLPPEVAQLPGVRYVLTTNGATVWDLGSEQMCIRDRSSAARLRGFVPEATLSVTASPCHLSRKGEALAGA